MTQPKPMKPLQLISFDSNKRLSVNPQAIAWLQTVNQDRHVGVVTVVGKYRTGKSYILNRVLLNQNSGFEVGPTINACTKGLWVWPELISNPDDPTIQYMVMDTEGLGSLQEGEQTDTKIFLMALLLSSYFIYNSVGSIDEKAVQNLSLIINLSKLLQKGGEQETQDIYDCFPKFLWLVRDFALRLEDEQGKPISSKEYLENALRIQKGTSELVVRKNIIRKEMNNFFRERDCFMLIRPVDDEKKLQNMSGLKDSQLRPKFLDLIQQLQTKVFSQIRKKHFKGKPCSPAMFVELCQHFCEAINKGGLPEIQSNWDLVCKAESNRVQKRCLTDFEALTKAYCLMDSKSINIKVFEAEAKQKIDQALKYFEKHALGDKTERKKVLKELMLEGYQKILKKATAGHNDEIDQAVTAINCELEYKSNQSHINNIFEITQRYDELIQTKLAEISGTVLTHLYKSCYEGFKATAHTYFGSNLQSQNHQKNVLKEKLGFCQSSLNRIQSDQSKQSHEADSRERELKQTVFQLEMKARQIYEQLQQAKKQLQVCKMNSENMPNLQNSLGE